MDTPSAPGPDGKPGNGNQHVKPLGSGMLNKDKGGVSVLGRGIGGVKSNAQRNKRLNPKQARQKQNKAAYKVASVKAPTYDPPQDPRDDTYYQNVAALDNMYGNQVAGALVDQQLDDNAYATNKARYTTDRERARRDLAESLLGTGGIRSGSHRREQTERDQDFMENIDRLNYDYGNAKAQRNIEIAGFGNERTAGYNIEYQEANQRAVDALLKQAENDQGNFALSIPRQVRQSNQKLKRLQAKRKEAKSDKQKAKIDEKIKQTRTDRARLVKRYRKSQKKNG